MGLAQSLLLADSWGMHGDVGAGWWIVMMIGMLLFWCAIIFGILWLVRGAGRGEWTFGHMHGGRESLIEILDRRFAEGEIGPEDYRARRDVLVNGGRGEPTAEAKER